MAAGTAQGLKPGDVIQDSYRIDALLGEGGMGATFRGTNLATGDVVAIKVMTAEFARVPKSVDLFKREARLLRTVRSDAVIRYETILQDKQGRLFLIMEFVAGRPLSHYIARGARLSPSDVLKLGIRLADGLAAIHALGIVHRDVAPDNIMIPDDAILKAKLIDFGLASDSSGTEKSIIGTSFAGKFSFSAPEQFGMAGGKIGPATDVYSLGLVLLKVAGLPVPGEGAGLGVGEHRRTDLFLAPDADVPGAMRSAVEQMLRLDPEARPRNPAAVLTAALRALEGAGNQNTLPDAEDFQITRDTAEDAAAQTAGKGRLIGTILAGLVLCGLAGAGYWGWSTGKFAASPAASAGSSQAQAETARALTTADDPLAEITARIDAGGEENLNAALASLMALARDAAQPADLRQRAYIAVAEMYDPASFDAKRSPFREPNANAAKRQYQAAADLGSELARNALDRMEE
ncbi:MAG: serine/threonine protein kinase [Rhodobacteraceae bacterium PARR1]|nr:MAG: serine/threonine protein kinase [Rhodobacteraceae bacterium PARR1]